MNLIERIQQEMQEDDGDTERESERIVLAYETADGITQARINDIFTSLCGWSLATLIREAKNEDQNK